VVPADEEEEDEDRTSDDDLDELLSPYSETSNVSESISSAELRHRKRMEQREKLEAQVRDMKRRQQANEQWTQLKRSLYKPLFIAGTIVLGGGLVAYLYFKD
jgi:tyrosine-protein phosphatase non-receptor type 1